MTPLESFQAEILLAIRLDHDLERAPEHQQHGQVLVHRKRLVPVFPGGCSFSVVAVRTGM